MSDLGVKRIYARVADGSVDAMIWTELIDETMVGIFQNEEIEIWAWSYNYSENEDAASRSIIYGRTNLI
ncbi:MAG: hypothetical protein ACJATI_001665 [Halioglobus sp.]